MNQIAEAECATCYRIRPKTEMRPARVRRKSGSSFGFWQSARTGDTDSRGQRKGGSYHTSYAHQEVWVCKGCKKPRSDWTPAHYAAILVLGLLAWLFLIPSSGTRTVEDPDSGNSRTTGPVSENTGEAEGQGFPTEEEIPNSETEDTSTPTVPPPESPSEPFDFNLPEISAAKIKAVTTGKAVRWKAGGNKGYAVPSEVTVAPETGTQCRNVYATVDDLEEQSPTLRMCQSPTGQWVQG